MSDGGWGFSCLENELQEEYGFEYCEVKIRKSEFLKIGVFRAVVQAHIFLFLFHWSDDKNIGSCADIWCENNDLQSKASFLEH